MHDLTGFQRDLLFVISGPNPSSGTTIKKEMEEYHDTQIHDSRLYDNLNSTVEKGLVKKSNSKQDSRINTYQLTERGERMIRNRRAWEQQYISGVEEMVVSS